MGSTRGTRGIGEGLRERTRVAKIIVLRTNFFGNEALERRFAARVFNVRKVKVRDDF